MWSAPPLASSQTPLLLPAPPVLTYVGAPSPAAANPLASSSAIQQPSLSTTTLDQLVQQI
jgi:hypothetical protein